MFLWYNSLFSIFEFQNRATNGSVSEREGERELTQISLQTNFKRHNESPVSPAILIDKYNLINYIDYNRTLLLPRTNIFHCRNVTFEQYNKKTTTTPLIMAHYQSKASQAWISRLEIQLESSCLVSEKKQMHLSMDSLFFSLHSDFVVVCFLKLDVNHIMWSDDFCLHILNPSFLMTNLSIYGRLSTSTYQCYLINKVNHSFESEINPI